MQPLTWTTHEFEQKERHRDWTWTVGLIFILGAVVAFFYSDAFFGIFLILAGALVIMFAVRKPKELIVALHDDMLSIDDHIIPYGSITGFWIDETQKPDKLLLLVRGSFVPVIMIHIYEVPAESVRTTLSGHGVVETPIRQPLSARIFERLGF
jgi:hypothetical protein